MANERKFFSRAVLVRINMLKRLRLPTNSAKPVLVFVRGLHQRASAGPRGPRAGPAGRAPGAGGPKKGVFGGLGQNPVLGVKNRAECTRRQGGYDPDQQVRLQINLIQGLIKYRKPPQNTPPSPENGENRTLAEKREMRGGVRNRTNSGFWRKRGFRGNFALRLRGVLGIFGADGRNPQYLLGFWTRRATQSTRVAAGFIGPLAELCVLMRTSTAREKNFLSFAVMALFIY